MANVRRKYRVQEPPFAVSVELAEGCNLYCGFCGLQGIREQKVKNYKFMTEKTLVSLMSQMRDLKWNARIGFQLHGEATMHPEYVKMVGITHEYRPKSNKSMLTNAGGLLRNPGPWANVRALFDAGLNVLSMDDYKGANLVPKVMSSIEKELGLTLESGKVYGGVQSGFTFYKYPQDLKGNPHTRRPRGSHTLIQVRDIAEQAADKARGNHTKLYNYAGVGFAPNDSMDGARCAQPFRQLAVRWDGSTSCCNDWRGVYKQGNVVTDGLSEVWQGNALGAMREMLIRGRREFAPCKGCDHRSYRVGLLPDLMGQGKLHKPDEQTAADIKRAIRGDPYTAAVLRPWESGK